MDVYDLLKKAARINSPRLKLLGLFLLHITRQCYLGVFLDPILACNLRCRMCYFSDENYRKELKGSIPIEELRQIAKALFHRALKVQIGCGAEPTLYKKLPEVISLAKKQKVPFVSITTNGNLLTEELIEEYIEAGLDELTLSMHGVYEKTYESFMQNASYEKFCRVIELLSEARRKSGLNIRINYTINADNLDELGELFGHFPHMEIDTLQLRPIENIGKADYDNYSHERLIENYIKVIERLKSEAQARKIRCIAPSYEQLCAPEGQNLRAAIFDSSYCYISPKFCWREGFNFHTDSFESYSRRQGIARKMLSDVLAGPAGLYRQKRSLNYELS